MKLSVSQLRRIIKEEVQRTLAEAAGQSVTFEAPADLGRKTYKAGTDVTRHPGVRSWGARIVPDKAVVINPHDQGNSGLPLLQVTFGPDRMEDAKGYFKEMVSDDDEEWEEFVLNDPKSFA